MCVCVCVCVCVCCVCVCVCSSVSCLPQTCLKSFVFLLHVACICIGFLMCGCVLRIYMHAHGYTQKQTNYFLYRRNLGKIQAPWGMVGMCLCVCCLSVAFAALSVSLPLSRSLASLSHTRRHAHTHTHTHTRSLTNSYLQVRCEREGHPTANGQTGASLQRNAAAKLPCRITHNRRN